MTYREPIFISEYYTGDEDLYFVLDGSIFMKDNSLEDYFVRVTYKEFKQKFNLSNADFLVLAIKYQLR